MLPFRVRLTPGESPYRQVVYAATRAVVAGELPVGTHFPSVREISQELKINPNTAHKVVAELVRDGILEVLPGIGTVVAEGWRTSAEERRRLLSDDVERLVVEAKRLGLGEAEVHQAVAGRWRSLFGVEDPEGGEGRSGGIQRSARETPDVLEVRSGAVEPRVRVAKTESVDPSGADGEGDPTPGEGRKSGAPGLVKARGPAEGRAAGGDAAARVGGRRPVASRKAKGGASA